MHCHRMKSGKSAQTEVLSAAPPTITGTSWPVPASCSNTVTLTVGLAMVTCRLKSANVQGSPPSEACTPSGRQTSKQKIQRDPGWQIMINRQKLSKELVIVLVQFFLVTNGRRATQQNLVERTFTLTSQHVRASSQNSASSQGVLLAKVCYQQRNVNAHQPSQSELCSQSGPLLVMSSFQSMKGLRVKKNNPPKALS